MGKLNMFDSRKKCTTYLRNLMKTCQYTFHQILEHWRPLYFNSTIPPFHPDPTEILIFIFTQQNSRYICFILNGPMLSGVMSIGQFCCELTTWGDAEILGENLIDALRPPSLQITGSRGYAILVYRSPCADYLPGCLVGELAALGPPSAASSQG